MQKRNVQTNEWSFSHRIHCCRLEIWRKKTKWKEEEEEEAIRENLAQTMSNVSEVSWGDNFNSCFPPCLLQSCLWTSSSKTSCACLCQAKFRTEKCCKSWNFDGRAGLLVCWTLGGRDRRKVFLVLVSNWLSSCQENPRTVWVVFPGFLKLSVDRCELLSPRSPFASCSFQLQTRWKVITTYGNPVCFRVLMCTSRFVSFPMMCLMSWSENEMSSHGRT